MYQHLLNKSHLQKLLSKADETNSYPVCNFPVVTNFCPLFSKKKQGLYGHVLITKAFWDELDHYCEQYFEAFKKQDKVDHVVSQIESAILKHPLGRYPLSGIHLRDVIQWLKSCLSR